MYDMTLGPDLKGVTVNNWLGRLDWIGFVHAEWRLSGGVSLYGRWVGVWVGIQSVLAVWERVLWWWGVLFVRLTSGWKGDVIRYGMV